MTEIWKPIPGWEDLYEVSDQGRVKSLYRSFINARGHHRIYPSRLIKIAGQSSKRGGYGVISLCHKGRQQTAHLHQLVASVFLGPKPKGMEVCHNDGDPTNNCAANLRYDTRASNQADRKRHGTDSIGVNHGRAKLNEMQVRLARRLKGRKGCTLAVANHWKITDTTLRHVQAGRTWSHI